MSVASVVATGGLLEREHEVEQLAARLNAVLAGEGSVVALEGEAGIGKSELMACLSRSARASAALALSQLGERDRARELAHEELERARVWGAPSTLSFALRAAAAIAGGDERIDLLRSAAAAVEHSPARHERALALTDYGAALRRAGHRRDARVPLREAFALADRCGARRTAARARDELLASGARPRRAALSGADSLTPSERRVSRLASDGLSNRDIAQQLFVTVRTVEGHLHQAYLKLDVTRREQLAPALQPPAR